MPRKAVSGGPKLQSLNLKTTQELRDRLEAAALVTGRALTQEVETRLSRSFDLDYFFGDGETALVLRTIGSALHAFEVQAGRPWSSAAGAQEEARSAIVGFLNALMGPLRGNVPAQGCEAIPLDLDDAEEVSGIRGIMLDKFIVEMQRHRQEHEQRTIALRPSGR